MASLQQILSWFKTGLFPNEDQFRQTWLSYWHKSEKIPQTQVFGLQETIESATQGLIWQEPVTNVTDLATTYPGAQKGWAAMVTSVGYIYSFNGAGWKNTGLKAFPDDVATQDDIVQIARESILFPKEVLSKTTSLGEKTTIEITLSTGYINNSGDVVNDSNFRHSQTISLDFGYLYRISISSGGGNSSKAITLKDATGKVIYNAPTNASNSDDYLFPVSATTIILCTTSSGSISLTKYAILNINDVIYSINNDFNKKINVISTNLNKYEEKNTGNNIVDVTTGIAEMQILNNGNIVKNSAYINFRLFSIYPKKGQTQISVSNGRQTTGALYDSNYNFIKYIELDNNTKTFNIENASFVYLNIRYATDLMVNYGSTPLPYEPFYCYFNATAKNVKELSSDALSEGSIQREKLFFSKKIFVSGTVLSEIGSNAQDTSSASYSGWGNRYNVSSNFKADALILHVKLPEFTLSIISGGSILLKRKVTSDEIETGMILLPSMYFSAGIIYDVLMDFDSTTSCYFTTTAVEGVTTALFRDNSTKNIASYPGAACTLFSIATLTNLVSETLLQIYSKEIVDLNISSSTNEFAIPSKLYAYSNLNNYFNFNNLKKYLDSDFLRIEGSNIKNYKNKAKVSNAANISATAKLYNNELKVIQSKAISIINSSVAAMTATKDFLSIGDSLTEGGRWHDKLKRLIGNKINIAGTVETLQGDTSNYTEGRSGWSLAMYFSMSKSENSYYSPFMHPTSGYYFGIAEKNANELANASTRGGIGKTLQRIGFNSNGYPSNPATNDVVYSIANARYERWNGSAWIDSGLSDSDFSFSVPKYMQAWKISNVDVLYVMLETNDFRTVDPLMVKSTFNSYKENLDVLIASAKEYKSSIVIGIGIANTYCGSDNNNGGYFNTKYTRALWEARKAKINAYDGRESENIYVVDWGAAFDTEFGFDAVNEKPFDDITTTDMLRLDGNTPHPGITNHGYFPMGQMIAAWIASLG